MIKLFCIYSQNLEIQTTKINDEITQFSSTIDPNKITLTLRKIFNGIWFLYDDSTQSNNPYQYESNQNILAFHCCKQGMLTIKQGTEVIQINQGDLCLHRIDSFSSPIFTPHHYIGLSILIEFKEIDHFPHVLMEEMPTNIMNFWENTSSSPFYYIHFNPKSNYFIQEFFNIHPITGNKTYLKIKMIELILYIEQEYAKQEDSTQSSNHQFEIIQQVKNDIDNNYDYNITIENLSKKYGISATSLKVLFKNTYHKPIISYLREVRLTNALSLLYDETLSISEISSKVGYANQSKFATAFKKHYSIAPHEYRSKIKKL